MNNEIAFANWLATAELADIVDQYVESYKDAHGIKARWMYGRETTREEMTKLWNQLNIEIEESIKRDEEAQAAFVKRLADCGLTEWAARNNIRTEYDLEDYNYQQQYLTQAEA